MAPRGRPRKRLSRMDAATDAMTAFGFDERLVQKTVKQLLKEYGGDDGWAFIEEYGYKELIEAILRDQESNDEDATKQKGVSSHDERAEDPALQSILGPSGTVVDSTYNKAGNTVGETSCSELVNAVEPIYVELFRNKQDICSTEVFCSPPVEGNGNSWKDVVEDQITTQKEMGTAVCRDGGNSKNQVQHGSNSHVFAPPPISPPYPVNYLKLCSGSHVQSWNNSHVSAPPPTASLCPVPVDHHPTAFPSSKGVYSQDEKAEDPALESTSCPLGTLVDSTYNEAGNTPGETGYSKLVDAVGEPTHGELCSHKQDIGNTGNGNKLNNVEKPFESGSPAIQQEILKLQGLGLIKPLSIGNRILALTLEVLCLPPAEGDGHRCKDIRGSQTSIQKGTANVFCSDGGNSGREMLQEGSNFHITIAPTSSPCPVNSVPPSADHLPTTLPSSKRVCLQQPRRHFPCYGWIGSDSEKEADDFIQLPPMKCIEFSI